MKYFFILTGCIIGAVITFIYFPRYEIQTDTVHTQSFIERCTATTTVATTEIGDIDTDCSYYMQYEKKYFICTNDQERLYQQYQDCLKKGL